MRLFHCLILFFHLAIITSACAQNISFKDHLWKERLLIVFAPSQNHAFLNEQIELLKDKKEGLLDRKMFNYIITPDSVYPYKMMNSHSTSDHMCYDKFNVSKNSFCTILIGLDGGEKHRQYTPISTDVLFGMVDKMHMRRSEIRKIK